MPRTMQIRLALLLGAALVPYPLHGSDLSQRASLAEVHAIGQIIVAMSAGPPGAEDALRQLIERRLENAGIAIDSTLNTQLVANVEVTRDTSSTGEKHFAYLISLTFQEPVRTERAPRTTFYATSWSGSMTVNRFQVNVGFQTVLDALEKKMSSFVTTVAKDTEAARHASRQ